MEKFSLEKWLQDKSRKVIDDDGFPVEIIKWDANEKCPVVYLNHNGIAYNVSVNGMYDADPNHGLFFSDEEEKMSEFEKELRYWIGQSLCNYENNGCVSDNMTDSVEVYLKDASKKLFDLARKEIIDEKLFSEAYHDGYKQGKQDTLKWKRNNSFFNTGNKFELGKTSLRRFDGYEIPYSELEKLPKEE